MTNQELKAQVMAILLAPHVATNVSDEEQIAIIKGARTAAEMIIELCAPEPIANEMD